MTQQEYINEFHKFLRENNAEEAFNYSVRKRGNGWDGQMIEVSKHEFLSRMFGWSETVEGEIFWSGLNLKWQLRLKELQSPERIAEAGKTISEEPRITEALYFIDEYKKGKKLQYMYWDSGTEVWGDVCSLNELLAALLDTRAIRVKPKKLRAYTLEELLGVPFDSRLKETSDGVNEWRFSGVFKRSKDIKVLLMLDGGHKRVCDASDMTTQFEYLDGRPFGVEE